MHVPQGLVVELIGAGEVGRAGVLLAAEERVEIVGEPRPRMDAVRDRADRHIFHPTVGPERVPHLTRDLGVQRRHAVRMARRAKREGREPERAVVG